MALLRRYAWPGNIRELENAIEHAFVICRDDVIAREHLPERIATKVRKHKSSLTQFGGSSPEAVIREWLARNDGDRSKVARELGMHRSTPWRKMRQYGICIP